MNEATSSTQHHAAAPALLRLPAVLALVGVGKTTLYRWARAGMFPKPRALTPTRSTVAWSAAEVHAWITGKLAANDGTYDGTSENESPQAA
jgi:prophage regulatory protein